MQDGESTTITVNGDAVLTLRINLWCSCSCAALSAAPRDLTITSHVLALAAASMRVTLSTV